MDIKKVGKPSKKARRGSRNEILHKIGELISVDHVDQVINRLMIGRPVRRGWEHK